MFCLIKAILAWLIDRHGTGGVIARGWWLHGWWRGAGRGQVDVKMKRPRLGGWNRAVVGTGWAKAARAGLRDSTGRHTCPWVQRRLANDFSPVTLSRDRYAQRQIGPLTRRLLLADGARCQGCVAWLTGGLGGDPKAKTFWSHFSAVTYFSSFYPNSEACAFYSCCCMLFIFFLLVLTVQEIFSCNE